MPKLKPTIEEATALLPEIMAPIALADSERQIRKMRRTVRVYDPDAAEKLLIARMEYLFQNNKSFQKGVMQKQQGRDYLLAFMAHWGCLIVDKHPMPRDLWKQDNYGLLFLTEEHNQQAQDRNWKKWFPNNPEAGK